MIQLVIAFLMKFIKPGYLREELFFEMQRVNHSIAVEVVFTHNGKILLEKRSEKDKFFPGLYHIPGTMLRGNEPINEAMRRLFREFELEEGSVLLKGCGGYDQKTPRGFIYHVVFLCELHINCKGKYFLPSKLPQNIVPYHKTLIDNLNNMKA